MMSISSSDWLPELLDALYEVAEPWEITKITRRQTLMEGVSGAYVFLVDVRSRALGVDGQGILKFRQNSDPYLSESINRELAAFTYSSSRFRDRFPAHLATERTNSFTVSVYSVAAGSLHFAAAFSSLLPQRAKMDAHRLIDDFILRSWPARPIKRRELSLQALIQTWLGHRFDPDQSRVPGLLQSYLVEPNFERLAVAENILPNPWAQLQHARASSTFPVYGGPCHGDFHGRNVIIGRRGTSYSPESFFIIDLDNFDEDKPIFYDNCYLMFDALLRHAGDRSSQEWLRFLSALRDHNPDGADSGMGELYAAWLSRMRGFCARSIDSKEYLERQLLAAGVAVGLSFAHKNLPSQQQRLNAFLYAAEQLKEYNDVFSPDTTAGSARITTLCDSISRQCSPHELRCLWADLSDCDSHNRGYVLISGEQNLTRRVAEGVARLPISLVIDVSDGQGLFQHAAAFIEQATYGVVWHAVDAGNTLDAAYASGAKVLMSCKTVGHNPIRHWNRVLREAVRAELVRLCSAIDNKPFTAIVCPGRTGQDLIDRVLEMLDGEFGDAFDRYVVLHGRGNPAEGLLPSWLSSMSPGDEAFLKEVSLGLQEVADAAELMYGASAAVQGVCVPHYGGDGGRRPVMKLLDQNDVVHWLEDFDIVHDGLGADENPQVEFERFLRGAPISWCGVRNNHDAERDYTASMLTSAERAFRQDVNQMVQLAHSPGAGGTTLGMRICWLLRRRYPTVVVRRYSEHLVDRLFGVSSATSLPLLVMMDAAALTVEEMEFVYGGLSSRHVKAVFLQVIRRQNRSRRSRHYHFYLPEEMTGGEVGSFVRSYAAYAEPDAVRKLEQLEVDPQMRRYRTPFFFGVTVFGEGYVRLQQRVQDAMAGSSSNVRQLLAALAVCGRYSQRGVSISVVNVLLARSPRARLDVHAALGEDASSLVFRHEGSLHVSHPAIGSQILAAFYGFPEIQHWGSYVADLLEPVISAAGSVFETDNEQTRFLQDLFIQRSAMFEESSAFSQLISDLPDLVAERLLEALARSFSRNAHYHHHLARFKNLRMRRPLSECLPHMTEASNLDPDDDIHHHGLGILYRTEAERLAAQASAAGGDEIKLRECYAAARPIVDIASAAFSRGRQINPTSEYNFVSHIQMNTRLVSSFFRGAEATTFDRFARGSEVYVPWCMELINEAQTHLDCVKRIRPDRLRPSDRVDRCAVDVTKLLGDPDALGLAYNSLLTSPTLADKSWVRRGLAAHYMRFISERGGEADKARAICDLVEQNLVEHPAANSGDIRLWFRAYRYNTAATIDDAMQKAEQWAAITDDVEAYYYRYILRFIAMRQGLFYGREQVQDAIRDCNAKLHRGQKTYIYEWWIGQPTHWPLVSAQELGEIRPGANFDRVGGSAALVEGTVKLIERPEFGMIELDGLKARFSPAGKFFRGQHEERRVAFKLGFRYDGLYAWDAVLL